MKRAGLVAAALLVAVFAVWWLRSSGPASEEAAGESPDAELPARDFAKGRALNPLLTAEVARELSGALAISGRVVDDRGPLPGATVTATVAVDGDTLSELPCSCGNSCGLKLLKCACGEAAGQLAELVQDRRGESVPMARVTTDGEGRFRIEGLGEGRIALWADAPSGVALNTAVRAGSEGVELKIANGVTLQGKVVNELEQPVGGAVVTAIYSKHSRYFDVLSQPDGSFELKGLPRGDYSVVAVVSGRLPDHHKIREGDDEQVALELLLPRTLAGTVSESGKPVGGARVKLSGEHKKLEVRSRADGSFSFGGLRPGRYVLTAGTGRLVAQTSAEVEKTDDKRGVQLSLAPAGFVTGTVRAPDGEAIAGAKLRLRRVDHGSPATEEVTSGAGGQFEVGPIEAGKYWVVVSAEGFIQKQELMHEATTGVDSNLTIVLDRGSVIRGTVRSESGEVLERAYVRVTRLERAAPQAARDGDDEGEDGTGEWVKVKEDGRFVVSLAKPGTYELTASADGLAPLSREVSAPSDEVALVLSAGARLIGRVVDAQGAAVAYAEVTLGSEDPKHPLERSARTDESGAFSLEGIPEGELKLTARPTAPGDAGRATLKLKVSGRTPPPVELRLGGGAPLNGRVVDAAGAAIEGAEVFVIPHPNAVKDDDRVEDYSRYARLTVQSARDGSFTFKNLDPGAYAVTATKEGYLPPSAAVAGPKDLPEHRPGGGRVVITLARQGRLIGRVLGAGWKPVLEFSVHGQLQKTTDGRFALPIRGEREFELQILATGYAVWTKRLKPDLKKDLDLGDIQLVSGRRLEGVVLDGNTGAPIADALVDTGDPPKDPRAQLGLSERLGAVRTGSNGRFVLPNVRETSRLIVVHKDGYPQLRQALDPSQPFVELLLDPGGTIRGKVALADGSTPSVLVQAVRVDGPPDTARDTTIEGRYALKGLARGRYVLGATARGGPSGPVFDPVEVDLAGTEATVNLTAVAGGATVRVRYPVEDSFLAVARGTLTQLTTDDWRLLRYRGRRPSNETEGAYEFRQLLPGRYTVVALVWSGEVPRYLLWPFTVTAAGIQEVQIPASTKLENFSKELTATLGE